MVFQENSFFHFDAFQARPGQARAISISFYGSYKNTFISSWRVLKALVMTYFSLWTFLEMVYII
jgi:hypothetical protein